MASTRSMFWRCSTTLRVSGHPSSLTSRAALIFLSNDEMPARRSESTGSSAWMLTCTWSRPASRRAWARGRDRPIALVTRFVYIPSELACPTSSTRSRRSRGSPPEKWLCRTPRSAASSSTRCQSAVASSAERLVSSSGVEQYEHDSGQACVSSASRPSGPSTVVSATGVLLDGDPAPGDELGEELRHLVVDDAVVPPPELVDDVGDATRPVAETEDVGAGGVERHDRLRAEQHLPVPGLVEAHLDEPGERGTAGERDGAGHAG